MLYAIVRGVPTVNGTGIDGRPLRTIADDDVVAVVSEVMEPGGETDERALWEYEHVVELLMGERSLVPARYGSVFSDSDDLRASIRARREQLGAALERVQGAVELGLRAHREHGADAPADQPGRPGTMYIENRLTQWRDGQRIARAVEPLAWLARAARPRLNPKPGVPFTSAYLVDRAAVPRFVARLEQIDSELDDVELTCTGPWPPYSFVEETEAESA